MLNIENWTEINDSYNSDFLSDLFWHSSKEKMSGQWPATASDMRCYNYCSMRDHILFDH